MPSLAKIQGTSGRTALASRFFKGLEFDRGLEPTEQRTPFVSSRPDVKTDRREPFLTDFGCFSSLLISCFQQRREKTAERKISSSDTDVQSYELVLLSDFGIQPICKRRGCKCCLVLIHSSRHLVRSRL